MTRRGPAGPVFSPVEATVPDTHRTKQALAHIPQRPRSITRLENWPLALRSVADFVTQAPGWLAQLRGRLAGYPLPFRRVHFASSDGTRLTAWLGVHTERGHETTRGSRGKPLPREGVLMVPGMFTTKDNVIAQGRALKMFKEWGYHVMTLDLRGFGESARTFNTAGWKESEDLMAAVEYFRAHVPLLKLHVYAESLGASAAILAAAAAARRGFRLVDGGILAVGPFADARNEVEYLSTRPVTKDTFFMVQWFFIQLLRLGGHPYDTFRDYVAAAAQAYAVDLDELYARSSPRHVVRDVNCPLLVLAALDDPIVPPSETRALQRLLRGRKNPTCWALPWGNHCAFEMADPDWFWTLLHEFFDFYCVLPPRPQPPLSRTAQEHAAAPRVQEGKRSQNAKVARPRHRPP